MKTKIYISIAIFFSVYNVFGQQVLITPNSSDNLKIGNAPIPTNAGQKGIVINNTETGLHTRVTLIDNSDGGNVSSYLTSEASPYSYLSGMKIGTSTNHPINFYTNGFAKAKLNKFGSFGVGVPEGGYSNEDKLLAKIEAVGVGDSSVDYGSYNPFKVSILGQARNVPVGFNSVGVMGISETIGNSGHYSIGLMGIPLKNPTTGGTNRPYFGTVNEVAFSNSSNRLIGLLNNVENLFESNSYPIYGTKNYVNNYGNDDSYATYNSSVSNKGNSYGTYNDVYSSSLDAIAYGVYNSIDPQAGSGYGVYNELKGTGGDRTGIFNDLTYGADNKPEYGTYNKITGNGTASKYGTYTTATSTDGYICGTCNFISGSGNKTVRLIGVKGASVSTSTHLWSYAYGGEFHAVADIGYAYGIYAKASGATVNKYAAYFDGNVNVTGNVTIIGSVSKTGGSFKIDHPKTQPINICTTVLLRAQI